MFQVQNFEWSILCDFYFTVRLELFSRIVADFNNCFRRSLKKNRDSNFFIMGQLCKFVRKLISRCIVPSFVPKCDAWSELLDFEAEDEKLLPCKDVLEKLRLKKKVETACKLRAEQMLTGKHVERATKDDRADAYFIEFAVDTRNFFVHMLANTLKIPDDTKDIMHGLACFDFDVLLHKSQAFAVQCFDKLYETFLLRDWVLKANEQLCREEYHDLLDYFRNLDSGSDFTSSSVPDMVSFLLLAPVMRERSHLLHLFKLACLCLTETSPEMPLVSYSRVDTSSPRCCYTDVIRPAQSYLSNVLDAVTVCVSEKNVPHIQKLSLAFGDSSFATNYDPWFFVDNFGRQNIYKSLLKSFSTPIVKTFSRTSPTSSTASSNVQQSPLKLSKRAKQHRQFGGVSLEERKDLVEELRQGSSKM